MSSKQRIDLTQGSVARHILRMLVPFWLAILAMLSAGVVDTIYIGHISTDALAAIGFCFPIVFFINSINIGLGAGTLSAISRDLGRKNMETARAHAASAILLTILIMLATTLLAVLLARPIVRSMGATETVLKLSMTYLYLGLPALIFTGIAMMCNNILRASGEAVLPSLIMVSGAIFNIIIDPFLIFGLGPFPRMEVAGAALGTLIASGLSAGIGLYLVAITRKAIRFAGLRRDDIVSAWRRIGHVALPATGTNTIVPLAAFAAVTIIARLLGKVDVAAFTVTARSEMLMISILFALSACIGANTGQNGGAGLSDRVRQAFSFSYQLCLGWGVLAGILGFVFAGHIPALFTTDPEVIALATPYFKIVPITFAGYGFVFVSAAGLNGLGRPLYGLVYTIIRSLVFYIGFIWIGAHIDGLRGVYLGIATANILSGAIAWYYTTRHVPMSVHQQT
ncbi:MAG TPA: MATE family efflux transporter [Hellea balneolensis]|uniref:MATE family efflux transporter n=1 Tax=Hellea balneolensis TaxID=287478 RepID=A0A7V5NWB0_9PROT|nr:MATE family efflux transporter [Hellea balneolensis]